MLNSFPESRINNHKTHMSHYFHERKIVQKQWQLCHYQLKGDHSPDNYQIPWRWMSSTPAHDKWYSHACTTSVNVNDQTMQLTINSFLPLFHDRFSPRHFPDRSQTPWHFQVLQTNGHPATNKKYCTPFEVDCLIRFASELVCMPGRINDTCIISWPQWQFLNWTIYVENTDELQDIEAS